MWTGQLLECRAHPHIEKGIKLCRSVDMAILKSLGCSHLVKPCQTRTSAKNAVCDAQNENTRLCMPGCTNSECVYTNQNKELRDCAPNVNTVHQADIVILDICVLPWERDCNMFGCIYLTIILHVFR